MERPDLKRAYRMMVHAEYGHSVAVERGWATGDSDGAFDRLGSIASFSTNVDKAKPQWHGAPDEPRFGQRGTLFDDATADSGISPLHMYAIVALPGAKCPRDGVDGCRHSLDPDGVLFFGSNNGGGKTSLLARHGAIEAIATNEPWLSKARADHMAGNGAFGIEVARDRRITTVIIADRISEESLRTVAAWRLIEDQFPTRKIRFWNDQGDDPAAWAAAERDNAKADDMAQANISRPVPIRLCRISSDKRKDVRVS